MCLGDEVISLKPGVRLLGLSPQMVFAHTVVAAYWVETQLGNVTVTSGCDGNHTNAPRPSGHYVGNALDYHIKSLWVGPQRASKVIALRDALRSALRDDFLVLAEDVDGPNEHLHVEWLPKRIT